MPPADFIEAMAPVVAILEELGVSYYVGGSVASACYGQLRATQDVALVADLQSVHVAPLVSALRGAYYVSASAVSDAIARHWCFNLIHFATMFKVDVFVAKQRPYDRTALARRRERALLKDDPRSLFFLASPEDIVLAKLEGFRLGDEVADQQWRDVITVLKVQANGLDRAYLDKWAVELGVDDLLAKARSQAEA